MTEEKWLARQKKSLDLLKLLVKISRTVDVDSIRQKYGWTKQRKTRIHFMDCRKHYTFTIKKGNLVVLTWPKNKDPDIQIEVDRLCVLKHLRQGKKLGIHPGTGDVVEMRYTLMSAWQYGDIRSYGESSTNDLMAFLDLFMDLMSNIDINEVVRIIGPCEHEGVKR